MVSVAAGTSRMTRDVCRRDGRAASVRQDIVAGAAGGGCSFGDTGACRVGDMTLEGAMIESERTSQNGRLDDVDAEVVEDLDVDGEGEADEVRGGTLWTDGCDPF